MAIHLSDSGHETHDLDRAFYRRVVQARSNGDLFECVKFASRSQDQRVLRAFVAAMFASKAHRHAITKCIREYIGKRAIPALLLNLNRLTPDRRMYQARLLCMLGYWEALAVYYGAMLEAQPLDANAKKCVDSFLTNYSPKLLSGMRAALGSNDPGFVFFCAPYLHKYDPLAVSNRLAEIARDPSANLDTKDKALHMLATFSPEAAAACLMDCGGNYPLQIVLSVLTQLAAAEDGKHLLPAILREFLQHQDDRRVAAALLLPEADPEARGRLYRWITGQLSHWSESGPGSEPPHRLRRIAQQLCRADHPEWVGYLERAATGGQLARFARNTLIASGHPAGLRLLRQWIAAASRPEDLFQPCIGAIRSYREDALDVLDLVVATRYAKLRERIEEVVAQTWPGRTINQLLEQRERAGETSVTSEPAAPTEPALAAAPPAEAQPTRQTRRRQRITSTLDRDRAIADAVKELEGYNCQVCGRKLVNARTGDPYAESHHVHPLGHEGSDDIDNLLCLCPLCHTLFHLGCVGIDAGLRIHATGAATQERLLKQLRLADGRSITREAFRYHWATLFIPPEDVRFDEREPDDE